MSFLKLCQRGKSLFQIKLLQSLEPNISFPNDWIFRYISKEKMKLVIRSHSCLISLNKSSNGNKNSSPGNHTELHYSIRNFFPIFSILHRDKRQSCKPKRRARAASNERCKIFARVCSDCRLSFNSNTLLNYMHKSQAHLLGNFP